jgi:beta-galactosidase
MKFRETLLSAIALAAIAGSSAAAPAHTFSIGEQFLLDGKHFEIRCGEVHAARVPEEYWRHRLQMAKAMGLNTVCAYLFWNMHEPRPGEFNWSGRADIAKFCKIAQEEGLWVVLRPGPYACAEWEMGGLPWWLLKDDDIKLRSTDPEFIAPAKRYLKEVGRVLGPLQVTKGGPILMVQAENEYGFYAKDASYMGEIREALLDAGFDVPLFACNPKHALRNGYRDDLFPVVNFGTDPAGAFKALREILPKGPLMCGEFYPGWFDTWGAPHHYGKTESYLKDLETMLEMDASFSIYMAHGGTSFGFSSGCDRPFKPDTSSYDYDAPISEAGWTTDKFFKTRDLFAKYLLPGETIPEPPAKNPVITFAPVTFTQSADLLKNLPKGVLDATPRAMEKYDQAFGAIVYSTQLPAGPAGMVEAPAIHDIGYIYLDGKRIAFTDRRNSSYKFKVPARGKPARLDMVVEAMGRVNFGPEVHDRKGINGNVTFDGRDLRNWKVFNLPFDDAMLAKLKFAAASGLPSDRPRVWKSEFTVDTPGDTFLDVSNWGKGLVWVNGHNLGRYWNIGPQQTMYLPGPWMKKGVNEILVLDYIGPQKPVIAGVATPVLDLLRPELDFASGLRPKVKLDLESGAVAHSGSFESGSDPLTVRFEKPLDGRYFCLEALSAQDGKPHAAVAELSLLDANGHPLNSEGASIAYVDTEERKKEDGSAENAIDGQTANFWHTRWSEAVMEYPHRLIIDLGGSRRIGGFVYTPRQGDDNVAGRIKDYKIIVGDGIVIPE